jgi:hypothetical protein
VADHIRDEVFRHIDGVLAEHNGEPEQEKRLAGLRRLRADLERLPAEHEAWQRAAAAFRRFSEAKRFALAGETGARYVPDALRDEAYMWAALTGAFDHHHTVAEDAVDFLGQVAGACDEVRENWTPGELTLTHNPRPELE